MPMLVAGIVGGFIGAVILYAAYYIGVALVGAASAPWPPTSRSR